MEKSSPSEGEDLVFQEAEIPWEFALEKMSTQMEKMISWQQNMQVMMNNNHYPPASEASTGVY